MLQPSEQPPPRRAQLGARDRLRRNRRCWTAADTPATVTTTAAAATVTTTTAAAAATVNTATATVTAVAAVAAAYGGEAA